MRVIGWIELPAGRYELSEGGWRGPDAGLADELNAAFAVGTHADFPGLPTGRAEVAAAAKAHGAEPHYPPLEPLPDGAVA